MASRRFLWLAAAPVTALITYACGGAKTTVPGGSEQSSGGSSGETGSGGTGDAGASSVGGGQGAISCQSDKACASAGQVCDVGRSVCVDCRVADDCAASSECVEGTCKTITACASSKECAAAGQVCDKALGRCVDCVSETDCSAGDLCVASKCVKSCGSDKDCAASDQVCDTLAGHCVECVLNDDCAANQYCTPSGSCAADVCTPGATQCAQDTLQTCNPVGSGFEGTTCADGCVNDTDPAHCMEPETPVCAGATADPCTSIPKFTGTQSVDGDPADFCDIPYRLMTAANAAFIAGPTGVLGQSPDGKTSQAQIRVAWSAEGLHVHVHVVDPAIVVGTAQKYNGDNVQLFVTTGTPPDDGYAMESACSASLAAVYGQQIYMIPESVSPAVSAKNTYTCPTWAPAAGTYKYASRLTADGYDVELLYPWQAAVTSGSTIGFDVMVGVNNTSTASTREYEYGLYMGATISSPNCTGPKGLYCDSGMWCTPTLAN